MKKYGVAETVILENDTNFKNICKDIKRHMLDDLKELCAMPIETLMQNRYDRFRKIGIYSEAEE
jgi:acetyl-CoA carboxylase carboxyl transferase subunit alpha